MAVPYGGVAEKVRRGSDDDVNSDEEEEYDKWIPNKPHAKGLNKMQPCRGCSGTFKFHVLVGQTLRESKSVQEFYSHCLDDCPQYMEMALTRTCDSCRSTFLNPEQKDMHIEECPSIAAEKARRRKPVRSAVPSPASSQRRRRTSTSSQSSNPESNSPDQNNDDDDDDNDDDDIDQQVQSAAERLIQIQAAKEKVAAAAAAAKAKQAQQNGPSTPAVRRSGPLSRTMPATSASAVTPAAQPGRPRPGPKSKTRPPGPEVGPIQRAPVVPKPEAVQQVAAARKLSGKNLAQLQQSLAPSVRKARPTPSKPATKKKPARKSSSKKRKREPDSEDSDEEEIPQFILDLPDVVLKPDEYLVHYPTKAKKLRYFNASETCPACKKSFAAAMSESLSSATTTPSLEYYAHCLTKCDGYMKKFMKSCGDCSHRYLNEEEFRVHKRGVCAANKKRVKNLKLRMPWMPLAQFLDLMDLTLNAHMCCEACHKEFPCHKKGEEYTPSLELHCHMLDECLDYRETGKIVECRKCASKPDAFFWYINDAVFKQYDACYVPDPDSDDDEDERNDPNSPYYGKGRGKGKGGPV